MCAPTHSHSAGATAHALCHHHLNRRAHGPQDELLDCLHCLARGLRMYVYVFNFDGLNFKGLRARYRKRIAEKMNAEQVDADKAVDAAQARQASRSTSNHP